MKRIFLFLSIVLCSLSMTAQSAWLFNRGDSISWQPSQDMTITFEKDPAGFFWQNIQTGTLDIVRMPIYTNDGITFADTPFMQVEKNHLEVTNDGDHRFEVRLKTNISDWNTITCQPQADWLRLIDTNGSQFPVITYVFEYDDNYTGTNRETEISFSRNDLSDIVSVFSVGEAATFNVSPKEIIVTNSQDPHQFTVSLSSNVNEVLAGSTYEIIGSDTEWLRCVGDESNEMGRSFTFTYDQNYTGQDRELWIVFMNGQYNLSDIVKVISINETAQIDLTPKIIETTDSATLTNGEIKIKIESTSKNLLEGIEYKIPDECSEWVNLYYPSLIENDGSYSLIYTFGILPNNKSLKREGKIYFTNPAIGYKDSVAIKTEGYMHFRKKDLHMINWQFYPQFPFGLVNEIETNVASIYLESNDFVSEIISADKDWIRINNSVEVVCDKNETSQTREALIALSNPKFGFKDTLKVIQYPTEIVQNKSIIVCQSEGGVVEIPVLGGAFIGEDVSVVTDNLPDYMVPIPSEIRDGNLYLRYRLSENTDALERKKNIEVRIGDVSAYRAFDVIQIGRGAPSFAEQKEALRELYDSTHGEHWKDNTNWLSDKPIDEWYGLNYNVLGDYVLQVNLNSNGLVGELPAKFSLLMPDMLDDSYGTSVVLNGNGIYGKLPAAVRNHPSWQKYGWNIIQQSPYESGQLFESDDWGLKVDDYTIDDVQGNLTSSKELFAKYKLLTIMNNAPSDEMINLHMSYQNRGYGTVFSSYDWLSQTRENLAELVETTPIELEGIWNCEWSDKQLDGIRWNGSWFIVDNEGNLVSFLGRDWDIPESWYASKVDSICRARLGEPEEHEPYSSTYYTSTDYSWDGEVVTLQQASVGKGIDLVLMGDAYVDTDMNDGGKYETDMRQGMEEFFAIEPYKSFRNRFNVYAVKVVSPNSHIGNGCEQKLNYDDTICFQYAQRVEGVDMDNVTIVNIVNNPNLFWVSGHANMYDNGSSVAHIEVGGVSEVIVHEAGGHGFAKLLDEYIFDGYEENHTQDGANESFREWIKTAYHDKGWGMNVAATDVESEVPWAHFLQDDRYKSEVGIYQGAWMWPYELWRPSENSVMNSDYTWFNAPSREAIYKRVMKLSEGDSWTYDYETFVAFDAPARAANSRQKNAPKKAQAKTAPTRRIESRPPTIYKGTWRDAGKCEKVEIPF